MKWVAAVLLAATAALANAQGIPDARAFVDHVYSRYSDAKTRNTDLVLGKDAAQIFSPSLLKLMRQDSRRSGPDSVGQLDFDPVCACQDPGGMRVLSTTIAAHPLKEAVAVVRLHFPEPTTIAVRLTLILTDEGWRIDDISTADVPSLRELLH